MKRWLWRFLFVSSFAFVSTIAWLSLRGTELENLPLYSIGHTPAATISHDGRFLIERTRSQITFGLFLANYHSINGGNGFYCPTGWLLSPADWISIKNRRWGSFGVSVYSSGINPGETVHILAVAAPPMAWIALGLVVPLARFLAWRFWKKPSTGRCLTCGYDLRATPTRCPECGTPVPARAATSADRLHSPA